MVNGMFCLFRVLCETIKEFISKMGSLYTESAENQTESDSIAYKCNILNEKLDLLLNTLHDETSSSRTVTADDEDSVHHDEQVSRFKRLQCADPVNRLPIVRSREIPFRRLSKTSRPRRRETRIVLFVTRERARYYHLSRRRICFRSVLSGREKKIIFFVFSLLPLLALEIRSARSVDVTCQ